MKGNNTPPQEVIDLTTTFFMKFLNHWLEKFQENLGHVVLNAHKKCVADPDYELTKDESFCIAMKFGWPVEFPPQSGNEPLKIKLAYPARVRFVDGKFLVSQDFHNKE